MSAQAAENPSEKLGDDGDEPAPDLASSIGNAPVGGSEARGDDAKSATAVASNVIDEASDQTFPASDAPAWTIAYIGPPRRTREVENARSALR